MAAAPVAEAGDKRRSELLPMKIDLGDKRCKEMQELSGASQIVPPLPRRKLSGSVSTDDSDPEELEPSGDSNDGNGAAIPALEEANPLGYFRAASATEADGAYYSAFAAGALHYWGQQNWDGNQLCWPHCHEEMWAGADAWWGHGPAGIWCDPGQYVHLAPGIGPQDEVAPQASLRPGDVVRFRGLKMATELNGTCGVVNRFDEASGRWVVIQAGGEERFTRRENLRLDQAGGCRVWPGSEASLHQTAAGTNPRFSAQAQAQARRPSSASKATAKVAAKAKASAAVAATSQDKDAPSTPAEATTIMMRNLPNKYTRESLLELLDQEGFGGLYDLIYLPVDFNTKVGLGYAFVNLVTPADAKRFRERFDGFSGWAGVVGSQKVCRVSWSDAVQGVEAHVERYRNSPVMHPSVPDEYKPQLFQGGEPVPFPPPTGRIKAPRARRSGYLQPQPQP